MISGTRSMIQASASSIWPSSYLILAIRLAGKAAATEFGPTPCSAIRKPSRYCASAAGIIKSLHGITGLRQHAAVGGKARAFQGEHKAVGHLACPFAKTLRLLRTVVGAVDLD